MRLALGKPHSVSDVLHQFCLLPVTIHVRISALDHPNVVADDEIVPGSVARNRSPETATLWPWIATLQLAYPGHLS